MSLRYRYLCRDGSLIHPGVPAHDLTDKDLAALTPEQRITVEASELYEAVGEHKPTPAVEPATKPDWPAKEGER